jgi:hypothetical protein
LRAILASCLSPVHEQPPRGLLRPESGYRTVFSAKIYRTDSSNAHDPPSVKSGIEMLELMLFEVRHAIE